jgi:hypothetical protein
MKQLFNKFYFLLMGPLYRKLSRDVVLHMQELKRSQLEFQDRFAAEVCDQLVVNSVVASETDLTKYSDEQIIHFVVDVINSSQDLVALSKKEQLPLKDLVEMYSRYGGMDPIAIRRLRGMEKQNIALTNAVEHVAGLRR